MVILSDLVFMSWAMVVVSGAMVVISSALVLALRAVVISGGLVVVSGGLVVGSRGLVVVSGGLVVVSWLVCTASEVSSESTKDSVSKIIPNKMISKHERHLYCNSCQQNRFRYLNQDFCWFGCGFTCSFSDIPWCVNLRGSANRFT